MEMHNPAHPSEVLIDGFIEPAGFSVTEVARRLGLSRKHTSEFLGGKVGVSVEMAFKLAAATGIAADVWLRMQVQYDLWQGKRNKLDRVKVESLRVALAA
jgi:antitoxin HigA-1